MTLKNAKVFKDIRNSGFSGEPEDGLNSPQHRV